MLKELAKRTKVFCFLPLLGSYDIFLTGELCFHLNLLEQIVLTDVLGARSDSPLRPVGGGGHRCAPMECALPGAAYPRDIWSEILEDVYFARYQIMFSLLHYFKINRYRFLVHLCI